MRRIAQLRVRLPVALGDAQQQPLVEIEDLLDRGLFVADADWS